LAASLASIALLGLGVASATWHARQTINYQGQIVTEHISTLFIILLAAIVIAPRIHIALLRSSGVYPRAGQATPEDVQRLLSSGRSALAMRCFRDIHGCSLKQAKAAIEAMQQEAGLVR
jgi:ribosomal protein L7/L12